MAVVEGPDFVDDGGEAALGDQFEDGAQFVFGAHVGAEDGKLAGEEKPEIDFCVVAGGGAAGDEAAPVGETFDAVVPSGGAHMFEDHVDAVVIGEAADFLANGHDAVMDDFVGADLFGFGEFFVVAGGGDDASAEEFGDLDGGAANAAAGGKNEHGFAGLELRASDEHVPGGLEDERNGGGVTQSRFSGYGQAIHIRAAHVFGAAAIDHVTEIGVIAAALSLPERQAGHLPQVMPGARTTFWPT